ncbi:hypothetical protein DFP73DRAFT_594819 [Morchella snyderi]|nr:hypothetical protein DFP73DRAFT_594819 [Morchella snyderi]
MPSKLQLRKRFRSLFSRKASPAPGPTSPVPLPAGGIQASTSAVNNPPPPSASAANNPPPPSTSAVNNPPPPPSTSVTNNPPPPSTSAVNNPPPPPSTSPGPLPVQAENPGFVLALKKHVNGLSPEERQAFNSSNTITPDSLISKIRDYDNAHLESSTSRRCAARIEGFLTAVNGYLGPLSIMIGHNPEISSLVVGGAKLIVQLGLKFINFFNKLTEMMEHLSGHLGYLSRYASYFNASVTIQEALSAAYGDLLRFFTGARKVFVDDKGNQSRWVSFRVFLQITWEPFEENFNSLHSEFRNHVKIVIRTASIEEYERLRSEKLLEEEEKEDKDRYKVLSWFSELDFDHDHNRIFSKRYQDTGEWLVNSPDFKQWDDSKKSSLLWCYGSPGVGKSVLASLVLEHISTKYSLDSRTGIAFVYFNFQDQENQKPIDIISTMIKQLARRKDVIPSSLRQFYKTYHRDARFPTKEKLEVQLLEISKTFDQVFLIMDAMDEFEDRKEFLSMITRFVAGGSQMRFKVFVTSRKEGDIEHTFTRHGFPVIQVEAKSVDADISAFVRYEVEKRSKESRWVKIDSKLQARITDSLTSKSSGVFLWVNYQLDYIFEQPTVGDIVTALGTLPVDMNATYARILRKIDKQVPAKREIARKVLTWVTCTKRPLNHEELATALAIKPETTEHKELVDQLIGKEILIEACCNLIVFEGDRFRPFHYTVQEFLTSTDLELPDSVDMTFLQKYQTTINTHAKLAETCLQYMLLPELGHDRPWYELYRFPLLKYAAAFWYQHVNDLPGLPESLAHSIETFLNDNHEGNLLQALRTVKKEFYQTESINSLNYCLSFNILHLFEKSHQFGTSISSQEKYKESLHYAAHGGSIPAVERLLESGFSVNSYDNGKHTPLYIAASAGNKETVKFLVEKGADLSIECGDHGTALGVAAYEGHLETVKMLLDLGADVNAPGGDYCSALQAAACNGHLETAKLLLDRGADANTHSENIWGCALQAASTEGHLETAQMLVDRGADINAQNGHYGSAIQGAAFEGRLKTVKMLLDLGADIDTHGGRYGRALQAAACKGNMEVIQLLVDRGADVNARGGFYGSALQGAAFEGHLKTVQMLLDQGADVNVEGGTCGRPLQAAAMKGRLEIVQLLVDRGADINAQVEKYGSALQTAATNKHPEIVQLLVDRGADVNAQIEDYGSAPQTVVENGKLETVKILLDRGADDNAQAVDCGDALLAAA